MLGDATEILSEAEVSEAEGKLIKAIEQCGEVGFSRSTYIQVILIKQVPLCSSREEEINN